MAVRKTNKTYKHCGEAKKAFPNVLFNCLGHIGDACNTVKISRVTYFDWYNSDPEFKDQIDEIKEKLVDEAEHNLFTHNRKGDLKAAQFILKHLGRKRGYSENKTIEIGNKEGETFKSELSQAQIDAIIRAAHDPKYKHD
jgi:hypothetical protein